MDDVITVNEEDLHNIPGLGDLQKFTDESLLDDLIESGEIVKN